VLININLQDATLELLQGATQDRQVFLVAQVRIVLVPAQCIADPDEEVRVLAKPDDRNLMCEEQGHTGGAGIGHGHEQGRGILVYHEFWPRGLLSGRTGCLLHWVCSFHKKLKTLEIFADTDEMHGFAHVRAPFTKS
jgi:hypothetical protein